MILEDVRLKRSARQMPKCEKDYCYYCNTKTIMPNNVVCCWLLCAPYAKVTWHHHPNHIFKHIKIGNENVILIVIVRYYVRVTHTALSLSFSPSPSHTYKLSLIFQRSNRLPSGPCRTYTIKCWMLYYSILKFQFMVYNWAIHWIRAKASEREGANERWSEWESVSEGEWEIESHKTVLCARTIQMVHGDDAHSCNILDHK